jgi:hypothetical protein
MPHPAKALIQNLYLHLWANNEGVQYFVFPHVKFLYQSILLTAHPMQKIFLAIAFLLPRLLFSLSAGKQAIIPSALVHGSSYSIIQKAFLHYHIAG